jgi:hypothetical protein
LRFLRATIFRFRDFSIRSRRASRTAHGLTFSVFGFETPIRYPFGLERTGYLVTDIVTAIRAARATGADILVSPFNDPIGRDAIIQWPGGVNTQI